MRGFDRLAADLARAVTAPDAGEQALADHEQQAAHFLAATAPVWQRLGLPNTRTAKPRK